MDNVFDIKGLTFSYGTNEVIKGLDLSIKQGKVTTLIGANGCGKSTLFNLITKNLRPNSGEIRLEGKDISQVKLKDFARQVAIVHQYNTAPADISVEKLVAFGRTPYHGFGSPSNSEEDEEKIKRALEITNTEKLKDKAVAQLSGGQKQRVWIAMALAQDTKILFLDEPTTYLDIRYQLQILKLVRKLNEEYGMTVIMVLHDINQSLYYSDEIVAMKDGRITAQGKPEEIITSELIKNVYDVELGISAVNGRPFVLPV
ncbi:ABC transporter ATP-binding protein [uncultured Ruminococcus sp.]|uniref:ABC transporter ATP-binding protein n=1 Tax=Ruminococcus sp. TaxID=41978 RepID=UPI00266FB149|nr:ABC transporter ATP-binding protein [uncultured Ruminococcus sp.]